MTAKTEIAARLGETDVLLPALIADALAANDRIKIRLSLLQDAARHAQAPEHAPAASVAGLGDIPARLAADSKAIGTDRLYAPGLSQLIAGMREDLESMAAPLRTADASRYADLLRRVQALSWPAASNDQLGFADVETLTSASRDGPDTLHLVVMDLHKALNALAASTATEDLDGAHAYGLDDAARAAVRAFMKGLNRTAPLAFGHPGLGTTAVKANGRLTIQNDIGTTDAHILVVHVDEAHVTVTYTDVHRARAKFFIALFNGDGVDWSPLAERESRGLSTDAFYLVAGTYAFTQTAARDAFLENLGSRIVFLIDWNKARKALQTFVGKQAAIDLLIWAAHRDLGHRAFLELGGADLVYEAVEHVAAGRIPYGARLDAAIGPTECREFLEQVLRDTSEGLAAGRTARLIRDEIQADLARRFETAESAVLTVLVRHLGLTRMLADMLAGVLSEPALPPRSERQALARRGKLIEAKADRLTLAAREIAAKLKDEAELRGVIDEIENATDVLEDCTFLVSLLPEKTQLMAAPMAELADAVTHSASELVRAVESASRLPGGQRSDAVRSLQAIDSVVTAERDADGIERDVFGAVMAKPQTDARPLVLCLEIARALETATDHFAHAAHGLRDRVLQELSA